MSATAAGLLRGLDEEPFDASTFTNNRERLIEHEVAKEFFGAVVRRARAEGLVSSQHFSVDGIPKTHLLAHFTGAAYNLLRMARLIQ